MVQEAWKKGVKFKKDGKIRYIYDFKKPIGNLHDGRPVTKVEVFQDNNGLIHGFPSNKPF